jgi:hypothetical protein
MTGAMGPGSIGMVVLTLMTGATAPGSAGDELNDLAGDFVNPPDSARPWVYWFWLNGNITKEGVTADLEAMQRVGIGGVLIMEVDQGAPAGPVDFVGDQWRELFMHVLAEAERLGLEVNMNNDAGWNGSGGPWIKPEESMQKVVWSEIELEGPEYFEGALAQPETVAGYYRDIAVRAFPSPGAYRIDNIQVKACYQVGFPGPPEQAELPPEELIAGDAIVDLTGKMDEGGRLLWDVPAGKWTVLRFGHTSTGVQNHPAPATGRGLECDKLSKKGIEANFAGMMAKLIDDAGPLAGKTLMATHVDSWENGAQNWTDAMRDEFRKRRGYDPLSYLPVMTGRVIEGLEVSERFLWDLRQTISELVVENYAGHLHDLAERYGMRFSIEAYGGPCDDVPYAGRADEPMSEFWIGGGALPTCKEMSSAAHVYGKPIVGAEAFTATDQERWREHPASIKALGDRAFCDGVNRFVFHRYAMQPWLDRRPGMTMGPWGIHYERTQTWWDLTPAWHEYLARCQHMLRQGRFVADICYLRPEAAPQSYVPRHPKGYDFDECSAEAVLTRMTVENGRLVLPDGMSYRLLVLPDTRVMTPPLLRRIEELVRAGAIIVGPPPTRSPSLDGYPQCDEEVRQLAGAVWGDCNGATVTEHRYGEGRAIWGLPPETVLHEMGVQPDFTSPAGFHWIHRAAGDGDIYFVASPHEQPVTATCTFRVQGKRPELWRPDSGGIEAAAVFEERGGLTHVSLNLEPSGSVFVVFGEPLRSSDSVVSVKRDGKALFTASAARPEIKVTKAVYGVLDDPSRSRDVTDRVQRIVESGQTTFETTPVAEGWDPAYGVVKTLVVNYTVGGEQLEARGVDFETVTLAPPSASSGVAEMHIDEQGRPLLEAWAPGRYQLTTAAGQEHSVDVAALPPPITVAGPWDLRFPSGWGAPEQVKLDTLMSWSDHSDPGVKYFSGIGTYAAVVAVPEAMFGVNRRLYLDLGTVKVMARARLNGTALGILWKPPYRVDVTDLAKPGDNTLEVEVANLWVNRLIGDESLPEDSARNPNGTLKEWPEWLAQGAPSPSGRHTFTTWRLWSKDDPLEESGLLGPVTLRAVELAPVEFGG